MKKVLVTALAALAAIASFADAPTVTDVVAKQRYPWNGLVDITCKVSGVEGAVGETWLSVAAVLPESGTPFRASHVWVIRDGAQSSDRQVRADGDYRLLWDARADLGQVSYSNMVVRVTIAVHKKIQLWAGGPYWADANIGAELPSDSGYYFWWGDTVGYMYVNNAWVASDGSTNNYSFTENNTPTYNEGLSTLRSKGWITSDGVLAQQYDAAQVQWGAGWRMPTEQELKDLKANCEWEQSTLNGVDGYVVKGKGDYASASIYLPKAGSVLKTEIADVGSIGYIWSATPHSSGGLASKALYFGGMFNYQTISYYPRHYGRSIRPVMSPAQ